VGHLQVVILTFGVAIQCAGLFYVYKGLGGERDLVTILVSTISFLMYIYVVMDYVTIRVLNLSAILSSNGCNFHTGQYYNLKMAHIQDRNM